MSEPQAANDATRPEMPEAFLALLRDHLAPPGAVKLILSKRRGGDPDLRRVTVRPLELREEACLSFLYQYTTRDVTTNLASDEGFQTVASLLGSPFFRANLLLPDEDIQLDISKKGKVTWHRHKASYNRAPLNGHDREKHRLVDVSRPFLLALGITNEQHQVMPSMSRKWKQINKFLEVFAQACDATGIAERKVVHVVDFGSGKGYLTFAVHDFLRSRYGVEPRVTGIEIRDNLVTFCREAAASLGLKGMSFCRGDVDSYAPEAADIMMALHACDVATDMAIHKGITLGSQIIMCAPCCHKELRPQFCIPSPLQPVLKFGVHLGQSAEMVTDGLRALLLEAHGYKAQVFEFVAPEHTHKNRMLLAVKHARPVRKDELLRQVSALKAFYGIREQHLETLLADD